MASVRGAQNELAAAHKDMFQKLQAYQADPSKTSEQALQQSQVAYGYTDRKLRAAQRHHLSRSSHRSITSHGESSPVNAYSMHDAPTDSEDCSPAAPPGRVSTTTPSQTTSPAAPVVRKTLITEKHSWTSFGRRPHVSEVEEHPLEQAIQRAQERPEGDVPLVVGGPKKRVEYAASAKRAKEQALELDHGVKHEHIAKETERWLSLVNDQPVLALVSQLCHPLYEEVRNLERKRVSMACERAGLFFTEELSQDRNKLYLLIWASEKRLMKEADRIRLLMPLRPSLVSPAVTLEDGRLKVLFDQASVAVYKGNLYMPFRGSKMPFFEPHSENCFFSSSDRIRLIRSILQATPSEKGAGININLLVAGSKEWRVTMSSADLDLLTKDEREAYERRLSTISGSKFQAKLTKLRQQNHENGSVLDSVGSGFAQGVDMFVATNQDSQESNDQKQYFEAIGDRAVFDRCVLFHNIKERDALMSNISAMFPWKHALQPRKFLHPPPVRAIRDYMGSKVAMYFAFMHTYTKVLYLVSPLSVLQLITQVLPANDDTEAYLGLETLVGPVMALVMTVAGTAFLETWKRAQSELNLNFTQDEQDEEPAQYDVRAEYVQHNKTKLERGVYDDKAGFIPIGQKVIYHFDYRITQRRVTRSIMLTICCCVCAVIFILGVFAFRVYLDVTSKAGQQLLSECRVYDETAPGAWSRDRYNYVTMITVGGAACVNGLLITVFNELYTKLAKYLTEWENHRTQAEFEKFLVLKMFAFKFINCYAACFYVAFIRSSRPQLFWMSNRDSCPNSRLYDREQPCDCFFDLTVQLAAQFLSRDVIARVVKFYAPTIQSLCSRRERLIEGRVSTRRCSKRDSSPSSSPHSGASRVDRRDDDGVHGQVDDDFGMQMDREMKLRVASGLYDEYTELAIQFGYVMMFSSVAPWLVVFAAIINSVDFRADGQTMLYNLQRRIPEHEKSIGIWYSIFETILSISILTNSFLVVFTSSTLDDDPFNSSTLDKLIIAISIEHVLLGLKFLTSELVPDTPSWVHVTKAFQKYVRGLAESAEGIHGVVDDVNAWSSAFQKNTPVLHASGHYDLASKRDLKRQVKQDESADYSAQMDAFCPAWQYPAGRST